MSVWFNAKRKRLSTQIVPGSYDVDVAHWLGTVWSTVITEEPQRPIQIRRFRNTAHTDFPFVQFQRELGQLQRNLAAVLQAFFRNNFRRTQFGIVSNYRRNRHLRAVQEYVKTQITLMR